MKLNKKHILIGSLVILSVVIIIAVIYGRKTETFKGDKNAKAGPGNVKTISTGASGAESCSATDCGGKSGTQYRNYTCTDPTSGSAVDYTLCAPLATDISQSCTTGACGARYGTATYTPAPPSCSPATYSLPQTLASQQCYVTDSFGNDILQTDTSACVAAGLSPAASSITYTGGTTLCKTNLQSTWYGNQFIHYVLPVGTVSATAPLSTGSQILKNSTANTSLGFNTAGTTITIPSGIVGNLVLFLFMSTANTGSTLSISTSYDSTSVDALNIFENNTASVATNASSANAATGTSFYYAFAFKKKSVTGTAVITFTLGGMFASSPAPNNPDLFLFQLNNNTSSICPATGNLNTIGFNPTGCLVGSRPMMARYYLPACTGTLPLGGTVATQLFDTIGSSNVKAGNGTCIVNQNGRITIPPLDTTTYFMFFIQWIGTAVPSPSFKPPTVSYSGSATNSVSYYNWSTGTSAFLSSYLSNTGDKNSGKMFYSSIFKVSAGTGNSTIVLTTSGNTFPSGTVNGDLLIVELIGTFP